MAETITKLRPGALLPDRATPRSSSNDTSAPGNRWRDRRVRNVHPSAGGMKACLMDASFQRCVDVHDVRTRDL